MYKGIIKRSQTTTSIIPQILFIVLLLILLSFPVSASDFTNGAFNGSTSGWTVVSGGYSTNTYDSTVYHTAAGSAKSFIQQNWVDYKQTVALDGVTNITFYSKNTFWGYYWTDIQVSIDGVNVGSKKAFSAQNTWDKFDIPITARTGSHVVCIDYSIQVNGNNYIYLDDAVLVSAVSSPVSNFIGHPLSGGVPLEVYFNDTSTGSPSAFEWFTDELVDTSRNTSYIYYNPGLYNVNLKASNSGGYDWENKTSYVNVSSDTVIWYNIGNSGLYLNANITNFLISHESDGIYIDYYVWENTTLGNSKHSTDLIFEDGILHPFTTFNPYYPTAYTANSYLYVRFLQDGVYRDVLAGSATWNNGYFNNDTLNSSDIPIIIPDVPPVPPVEPPIPNSQPDPAPSPGPDPAPPNPAPNPGPEPPLPPAPSNGSGNGSGDFPLEEPGNASLNYSGLGGYYTYVDNVFEPIHASVMGFLAFVISPINALSGYVSDLGVYLNEYSVGVGNTSFIASVVRPVFMAVPAPVYGLICISLLFTILAFVFRYR